MGEINALIEKSQNKLLKQIKNKIRLAIDAFNKEDLCGYAIQEYDVSVGDNGMVSMTVKTLADKETKDPIKKFSLDTIKTINISEDIGTFIKDKLGDKIYVKISDYYLKRIDERLYCHSKFE